MPRRREKFGCYDDSRGIRYLPPQYYIKIRDYEGGLKYGNWFDKNFPDDTGFPDFLFERAMIFFKTGKYSKAEKMAVKTYFSNTYLLDKFFDRPIVPIEKWEGSNIAGSDYADTLIYKSDQPDLTDFSDWLDDFISSDLFQKTTNEYLEISKTIIYRKRS